MAFITLHGSALNTETVLLVQAGARGHGEDIPVLLIHHTTGVTTTVSYLPEETTIQLERKLITGESYSGSDSPVMRRDRDLADLADLAARPSAEK